MRYLILSAPMARESQNQKGIPARKTGRARNASIPFQVGATRAQRLTSSFDHAWSHRTGPVSLPSAK